MVDYGNACESSRHNVRGGARGAIQWVPPVAGAVALAILLAGCSHMPWRHKPKASPPEVHELDESSDGGAPASYAQYWMRNTLVVDLQGVSGTGSVTLKPREHTTWPVRIALKLKPGSVGEIEVNAAQRAVLPVTPAGAKPVVVELSPSIYTFKTPQMVVAWGPNPAPAAE